MCLYYENLRFHGFPYFSVTFFLLTNVIKFNFFLLFLLLKLFQLLLEKEIYINEKDSKIKDLEKENQLLNEKLKKYKDIIKHYDENFNFSLFSNINQESDLHNIDLENNDDSHILTEKCIVIM